MDLPLWLIAIIAFIVINFMLVSASVLVYAERKVSGIMQNRPGPNRVGPFGFLQPFADVAKLLLKEDITPTASNKFIHSLAPVLMVAIAMTVPGMIPFARGVVIVDNSVTVLLILALTSISVYGVTLAGWSSNSKYSLLGGLRSAAQMISYELSMGLAVVAVVLLAGSLSVVDIVESQANGWAILGWNIFRTPVAAVIFIITAFAETNRAPFDLPEAETELVAGFHTEYTGMKFAMFFMGEYVNMVTMSSLVTLLFLGGWNSYGLPLWPILAFAGKVFFLLCVFIWLRSTFPRIRYDRLMTFGWKFLLPICLFNLLVTAVIKVLY